MSQQNEQRNEIEKVVINILKFSNQFKKILIQKLLAKKFDIEEINLIIQKYEDLGLIDDYKNGLSYARELINNNLYGKNIVIKKLYEKITDKQIIDRILNEIYQEYEEEEICRDYINKNFSDKILPDKKDKKTKKDFEKIIRHLINHGFEYTIIMKVLKKYNINLCSYD